MKAGDYAKVPGGPGKTRRTIFDVALVTAFIIPFASAILNGRSEPEGSKSRAPALSTQTSTNLGLAASAPIAASAPHGSIVR